MIDMQQRIKRNILKLGFKYPFFTYLATFCTFREDDTCPTMGVNKNGVVIYNKEWCNKLKGEELRGVIIHELLHLVYKHIDKNILRKKDFNIYNIACDIKVNENIIELNDNSNGGSFGGSIKLPPGGIIPDSYRDNVSVGTIIISNISKKNSLQIYEELCDRLPPEDKHSMDTQDEHRHDDNETNEKMSQSSSESSTNEEVSSEEFWRDKILEGAEHQKAKGDLPGFLNGIIGELEAPKLDWRDIIKDLVQGYDVSDYTWIRRHKNSRATNVYLPATVKESIKAQVYFDTSASVSDDELRRYVSEVNGIFEQFRSSTVEIVQFDTRIVHRQTLDDAVQELQIKGRGGTDFREVFKDDVLDEVDLCLIFSDGEDAYPSNRHNFQGEVIWCITRNSSVDNLKNKASNKDSFVEVTLEND